MSAAVWTMEMIIGIPWIFPAQCVGVSCGYDTQFAVRLVMGYTISLLLGQFWDTFRIPHDQASSSQTHRCPGVSGSRQSDHVIIFDQSQGAL